MEISELVFLAFAIGIPLSIFLYGIVGLLVISVVGLVVCFWLFCNSPNIEL